MHKTLCAAAAALLASAAAIAQPEKPGGLWEGCGGDGRPGSIRRLLTGRDSHPEQQRGRDHSGSNPHPVKWAPNRQRPPAMPGASVFASGRSPEDAGLR